ncbi:MAG: type II toxin-antitoxin system VapC family toxin [Acidimicrobiia bacterium]
MRALLDTSVFIRMADSPDVLARAALELIEDEAVELLLSSASAWEIAIKSSIGKLVLPESPERFVPERMGSMFVDPLPIAHVHALAVASLPPHHRDPFDRLLVAQARVERIPIISSDPVFARYEVELVRA